MSYPLPGVYGWSTGSGGVHYHRIGEPLRVAAAHGIPVSTGDRLDDEVLAAHDTVLVHMLWDAPNSEGWRRLADVGKHRLVFDIDDAMWAKDAWRPFREHYTTDVLRRVMANISAAHVVTTPSAYIAEYVSQYNRNVWIVPNTVPEVALEDPVGSGRPAGSGLIGYQGSPSHQFTDWRTYLSQDLLAVLDMRPGWDLHFWGPDEIPGWPQGRVTHTPWQKPGPTYYRQLLMDIGLAPTARTDFNRGKSGLRAIEYAARGIVGIFTDHEIYRPWVRDGETGLFLLDGERWQDKIIDLIDNPIRHAQMRQDARWTAQEWTTEKNIGRWTEAWNSV